jgi:DNA-binding beta-propeller fold protein YncE
MNRKYFIYIIVPLIAIFHLTSCSEDFQLPETIVDEKNNGFESFAVAEVFAKNCSSSDCHGQNNPQHQLKFTSHSEMIKGSMGRPLGEGHDHNQAAKTYHGETVYGGGPVIPFNAEKSLLYNLITGNIENPEHKMPYNRPPLSQSEINIIKDWIYNGARDFYGNVPFSNGSGKVYICNQGSDEIYEIDMEYKVVSAIIPVNFNITGTDAPHNIILKDDNIFVTLISSGKFLKISSATNQITGSVDGIENAGMIQLSKDGKTAFVSRSSTAPSIYNKIYAVNTESMTIKGEINLPVTGLPHAIALNNSGNLLYVANMTKDRISIIDANTLEPSADDILLSSGGVLVHEPMHIYISPDDRYLYVNCRTSSKMLIIDLTTKQIIQELMIKHHPMQSVVSKDGNKIYTVSHHEPFITEISKSGNSWSISKEFESEAFHHLYGADLSADEKFLYVTCANNDPANEFSPHYKIPGKTRPSLVCIYDTEKGELVKIIDIGSYATGIAARKN